MDVIARQLEIERLANDYSYTRLMKEINSRVKAGQADELVEGKMILVHSIDTLSAKIMEYFISQLKFTLKQSAFCIGKE